MKINKIQTKKSIYYGFIHNSKDMANFEAFFGGLNSSIINTNKPFKFMIYILFWITYPTRKLGALSKRDLATVCASSDTKSIITGSLKTWTLQLTGSKMPLENWGWHTLQPSDLSRNTQLPSTYLPLDILFPSNRNIHKSSCGHCFWASDLIERF